MRVKMILPALTEAKSPYWRPIKYSLFPPLGLATLAGYLDPDDPVVLQDEHVETLDLEDAPDLVLIQVYITNAFRAYALADYYRSRGAHVALGGLHVTSLPEEAAVHADTLFLGPAEEAFPRFLADFRRGQTEKVYVSRSRSLVDLPLLRRDLIRRSRYFVPNSLVVTRGCPHRCDFCYKEAFFEGGRSFYTQPVEQALTEIERLPGKHLYFLDDHLLGNRRFARELFAGLKGMKRVFQGAATVDSILRDDLIERAAEAGLRSLFVGFETLSEDNLRSSSKFQNLGQDYARAIQRLHDLGIMINGSFVFGLDHDGPDVFQRTVDWGIRMGLTTATYHILTPYPGTSLFQRLEAEGRILHRDWPRYDTRQVVYQTQGLSAEALQQGYDWAYREFYAWSRIWQSAAQHSDFKHRLKHLAYTSGWKKFEPVWNFLIKHELLGHTRSWLETVLAEVKPTFSGSQESGGSTGPVQRINEVTRF
ncbi:B12-binding domain-containing radical SAM protein [bacterium (Candidatus Blackallbacteria) CG17_big_fil_post_rev_8_21_14_2_50_48_46]|uniref:B12-binding domain-containing radical SAM protein n=1 Tax=bacterium (Candidatus Blackallbacteria) CG17_big_fil_post_rev_8_21_14_2_50_48_46 TaxID=2014261 RepID=A0A2M7G9A7_9BACT|nr:MAG: B12-binding domain-containing radical SAM protein [bacterium (Candidatus Blackallbacteria) CG18_big_fil_WC_8_21_14_2_50_49_26]PIW18688.1 MAG: B12-binding domain-containing radical SAM protein [bacterium (Candidatus Blackallbacteria) CG17_big_fil_post_rev_8_21_14_2_50_48_46]PIW46326.1 MAG: B12-binding domain-containing radical SAM protein [bacterium (Candidatus Blackallbacteria) CG13_big_fil_rev_8_21_14_2_50_49_14]